MNGRAVLFVLGALFALLALQFGLAFTSVPRAALPGVALVSIAIVAMSFMRLPAAGTLAAVFATAAVFWLCVMMGLGSLDSATRTDIPVTQTGVRPPHGGDPPR